MPDIRLDEPERIDGDVTLKLTGSGKARFRFQHTRDCDGQPDSLSWSDVTVMSHRFLPDPESVVVSEAIDKDRKGSGSVRGVVLDMVDGDVEIPYRRHTASWIRVVPFLTYNDPETDREVTESCSRYRISLEPRT